MKTSIVYVAVVTVLVMGLLKVQAQSKNLRGFPVKQTQAGESLLNVQQSENGAPFAALQVIALENDDWLNNLDDLVGRVVQVKADGNVIIMASLVKDGDSLRVRPGEKGDETHDQIKRDRAGSFSFLGISANITNEQLYEYNSTTIILCHVRDKQLDKTKVPASAICQGAGTCEFFYISGASARLSETTLYTNKGRRIKVDDLTAFGIAKPIDGSIYVGDLNKHNVKKYVIYCTLLAVPR